ncbi:MAG TPA: O-antigen ligase family protein [Chloroflexia bacterium]|nr:O-antigen ligase family protein [Chloroflexia bacterium]
MTATIRPGAAEEMAVPLRTEAPAARSAGEARSEGRLGLVSGRLLFGALLLVLAATPFEAGYPPLGRFAIGKSLGMTFTNLEAVLFVLGGAYLLRLLTSRSARGRLVHMPLLWLIIGLVAAAALSTLFGEFKSLGVQFIYRLLMGVMVYASAWEALAGKRRLFAALCSFAGAGLAAALVGLLEFAPWANFQVWLRAFKPQPTTVGGMLRLSGSFEYANGAAMYFEMALPVALALAVFFSSRLLTDDLFSSRRLSEVARRFWQFASYLLVGLFTTALILTFSRAAWAGALAGVGVMALAALLRRRSGPLRTERLVLRPLAAAVAVMALAAVYAAVTHPLLVLRLTAGENDRSWYKNSIIPGPVPPLSAGEVVTVPVTLRNEGPMVWQAERVPAVDLSYHWKNAGEGPDAQYYAVFEGERTRLPADVAPGGTVSVEAIVRAPAKPGNYLLEWDLVQERVAWFYEKSKLRTPPSLHTVRERSAADPKPMPVAPGAPQVAVQAIEDSDTSTVPRGKLWRAAFAMFLDHPLTGVGPDGFRNLYGKYAGVTQWSKNIYSNNTYIEMFANMGIIGGGIFLLLAALALWRSLRNILRQPVCAAWVLCLGATASLVCFFLHGFADYFLFSTPIYITFWLIMAVSVGWPSLLNRQLPAGKLSN